MAYHIVQAEVRTLTGETNRRTNEEKALMEEEQFAENLTKVELRESRAMCSSLRMKLNYYGEEVARLRQAMVAAINILLVMRQCSARSPEIFRGGLFTCLSRLVVTLRWLAQA